MSNLPANSVHGNLALSCDPQEQEGQTRISCPSPVVTGLDTLQISLHLNISDFSIFERFAFLKKEVQETMAPSVAVNFHSKEFFSWNLHRSGTKLHPFVLRSGDISLLLSSRPADSTIPNCQIEIGSVSSQDDCFGIYHKMLAWLQVYGMTVHKEIVSRVDLAADFIGTDINSTFVSFKDRWISRARKFSVYYDDWNLTGIMLGKGKLALRVYDKALELKRNKTKREFFLQLWGCDEATPVTRVEFQLRREGLKEFSLPVNTVRQLQKNIDSLWQYLSRDWARLARQSVDRKNKNHKQAETSDFWKEVQNLIFSFPAPKNQRQKKNLHKNIVALRDQARGCLLSLAAAMGHEVDDFFGIIATCIDAMSTDLADFMTDRQVDFVRLFDIRRNQCYVGF